MESSRALRRKYPARLPRPCQGLAPGPVSQRYPPQTFVEERLKEINTAYDLLMKGMPPFAKNPLRASRAPCAPCPDEQPSGNPSSRRHGHAHPSARARGGVSHGRARWRSRRGTRAARHRLTVPSGRTTVTGEQYWRGDGRESVAVLRRCDLPVEQVSWEDAAGSATG